MLYFLVYVHMYSLETATALNQEVYEVLLEVRKVEMKCTILKFVVL